MHMPSNPNLTSIRNAAKALQLPYPQLLKAVRTGKVKSVVLSKNPLVSVDAIREQLARSVGQRA